MNHNVTINTYIYLDDHDILENNHNVTINTYIYLDDHDIIEIYHNVTINTYIYLYHGRQGICMYL
jgi:hypothetical protein